LGALYVEYALNAFGLVPHMILLADFVARGLGQGLEAGARYRILFGLGAMTGPVLAGLRLAFLVQTVAIAVLAIDASSISLIVSSIIVGACVPGIVPLQRLSG
jgi:hypothetical protein